MSSSSTSQPYRCASASLSSATFRSDVWQNALSVRKEYKSFLRHRSAGAQSVPRRARLQLGAEHRAMREYGVPRGVLCIKALVRRTKWKFRMRPSDHGRHAILSDPPPELAQRATFTASPEAVRTSPITHGPEAVSSGQGPPYLEGRLGTRGRSVSRETRSTRRDRKPTWYGRAGGILQKTPSQAVRLKGLALSLLLMALIASSPAPKHTLFTWHDYIIRVYPGFPTLKL